MLINYDSSLLVGVLTFDELVITVVCINCKQNIIAKAVALGRNGLTEVIGAPIKTSYAQLTAFIGSNIRRIPRNMGLFDICHRPVLFHTVIEDIIPVHDIISQSEAINRKSCILLHKLRISFN